MSGFVSQIPSMALLGSGFTSELLWMIGILDYFLYPIGEADVFKFDVYMIWIEGYNCVIAGWVTCIAFSTWFQYRTSHSMETFAVLPESCFLSCSIGIGLPVYSTFKAIESRDENEQRKWLIYWAAYGSFSLVEVFTDKLISWFPLYYHAKFAFLVWLQLPTIEGAKQIYNHHLRPFLIRHQTKVDRLVDGAYEEMVKVVRSHQGEIRFVRSMIVKILGSGNEVATPRQRQGEITSISPEPATNRDSESESDHED
ncbi:unnamed protein product [Thlaspi arvense]|uniref:HVA22-like protein n=1 Tax=Thlaspi arvense TaxID=13288 RepID=A0AAU9T2Q7_THLAR|nr:unnamed protein product [Thlaspi arvense]